MYDLTGIYPEDIYNANAKRLYGTGAFYDNESLNIIKYARNKPNARILIYRAVPDPNVSMKKKIQQLNDLLNYRFKYGFFPVGNKIINEIETHYNHDDYSYDEWQDIIKLDIESKINKLKSQMSPKIKINHGDWVTNLREKKAPSFSYGDEFVTTKTLF